MGIDVAQGKYPFGISCYYRVCAVLKNEMPFWFFFAFFFIVPLSFLMSPSFFFPLSTLTLHQGVDDAWVHSSANGVTPSSSAGAFRSV